MSYYTGRLFTIVGSAERKAGREARQKNCRLSSRARERKGEKSVETCFQHSRLSVQFACNFKIGLHGFPRTVIIITLIITSQFLFARTTSKLHPGISSDCPIILAESRANKQRDAVRRVISAIGRCGGNKINDTRARDIIPHYTPARVSRTMSHGAGHAREARVSTHSRTFLPTHIRISRRLGRIIPTFVTTSTGRRSACTRATCPVAITSGQFRGRNDNLNDNFIPGIIARS